MDRERVLRDQTVVVRGNRITALGSANRIVVPANAMQIDGRGKFLLPGLADMHVHLTEDFGWVSASDTATWGKVLWLYLANGVTTVRDMHSTRSGGAASIPLRLRRQVAAGALLGPRIYTAGDPDFSSPAAAARSVNSLHPLAVDFVKIGDEGTPGPVYDSIQAAAQRVGLRLVGHVPAERGLERVLRDHWASIEHLSGYVDYLLGTEDLENGFPNNHELSWYQERVPSGGQLDVTKLRHIAVATRQAWVWNCPTLALWSRMVGIIDEMAHRDTAWTAKIPLVRQMAALHGQITKALQDAGAGLLLGTDMPSNFSGVPGFVIQDELTALVQAGLTPYQALAAGTRNVAQFLGTLDSTGTVAVGKRADLVLLAGNPLTDVGFVAGPAGVMLGGRWWSRAALDRTLDTLALKPARAKEVDDARRQVWHH